jgi:hypothetical protein
MHFTKIFAFIGLRYVNWHSMFGKGQRLTRILRSAFALAAPIETTINSAQDNCDNYARSMLPLNKYVRVIGWLAQTWIDSRDYNNCENARQDRKATENRLNNDKDRNNYDKDRYNQYEKRQSATLYFGVVYVWW